MGKTIKKAAGEFLLYLYSKQKETGFTDKKDLKFRIDYDHARIVEGHKLNEPLLAICEHNVPLAYNAVQYLIDKKLINIQKGLGGGSVRIFRDIALNENGIDMVEGVEGGENEKNRFSVTFNVKLADEVNIESLVKTELGSLIKASFDIILTLKI